MQKRTRHDLYRMIAFVIAIAAILVLDTSNMAVVQAIAISIAVALGTHITRRILFPGVDLQKLIESAWEQQNIAAAICACAIIAFLIAVMNVGLHVLK